MSSIYDYDWDDDTPQLADVLERVQDEADDMLLGRSEDVCVCAFASGRCGTHLLTQRRGSIDESIEAFREAAGYVLRLSVWEAAERSGELTAEAESYALSRNPAWTLADIEGPHRVETEVQEQRLFHD